MEKACWAGLILSLANPLGQPRGRPLRDPRAARDGASRKRTRRPVGHDDRVSDTRGLLGTTEFPQALWLGLAGLSSATSMR